MIAYKKKFLIVTYASGRVERLFCASQADEKKHKEKLAVMPSVKNVAVEEVRR